MGQKSSVWGLFGVYGYRVIQRVIGIYGRNSADSFSTVRSLFRLCRCRFLNNAHEKTAVVMAAALFLLYSGFRFLFGEDILYLLGGSVVG